MEPNTNSLRVEHEASVSLLQSLQATEVNPFTEQLMTFQQGSNDSKGTTESGLFSSQCFLLGVEMVTSQGLVHHQADYSQGSVSLKDMKHTGTCLSFGTDNPKSMQMPKLEVTTIKQG